VLRLAALVHMSGLDGVVCSAQEAGLIRARIDSSFLLVTPGIRPEAAAADDQIRVTTPTEAIGRGANYLVVGRPITRAAEPRAVLADINREVTLALAKGT
jgi:orotidine-5'-phosphate decarboxylase